MNKGVLFLTIFALLFFGVITRLLPHLPNATPLTAIALTSGIYLGKRWSVVLPVVVLFLSDMVIGFYDWKIMASVYGSFVFIGCLSWLNRTYGGVSFVCLSVVAASLLFFFITNSAVWLFSPWYEKSFTGLLYAWELGIPFLRNMLVGDLFYTTALIMFFEAVRAGTPMFHSKLDTARVQAGSVEAVSCSSQ